MALLHRNKTKGLHIPLCLLRYSSTLHYTTPHHTRQRLRKKIAPSGLAKDFTIPLRSYCIQYLKPTLFIAVCLFTISISNSRSRGEKEFR